MATPSIANKRQVGGDHYKVGGEEHWDRMYRLFGPGYFIGCITKYVERYQKKDGVKDLLKAQHYLEKLLELENTEEQEDHRSVISFGSDAEQVPLKPRSQCVHGLHPNDCHICRGR